MTANLVTVRPMAFAEKAFVYSNCRRMVAEVVDDRPMRTCRECLVLPRWAPPCPRHQYLDYSFVRDLTDHLVSNCTTRVAFVAGVGDDGTRPEIQGFIVDDERDGSIEFLFLRVPYGKMTGGELRGAIIRELVGPRAEIVLRRHAEITTMDAAGMGGSKVVVRPRSI